MRMTRYDHNFTAYTQTFDTYGQSTGTAVLYASFDMDIQPISKSAARLVELGLDGLSSKGRVGYHDVEYPLANDVIVVDNDTTEKYRIMNDAPWQGHLGAIMEPWTGTVSV